MVSKTSFTCYRIALPVLCLFLAFQVPAAGQGRQAKAEPETRFQVLPFTLDRVELLPSPFTENRDKTLAYLKFLDIDRMLHNFRVAAGLPSNALPPGGWESPDCKLRGHSVGHILSALAQAFASTADPVFREKINAIVSELARCQEHLAQRGYPPGFLSAYGPDQFNRLEQLTPYPEIWAPYYTLHKILAGLIASYELAGNRQALDVAEKAAGWVCRQLEDIPESRLQEMWNLYIAGEYGGMNEALAELSRLTGKKEFLVAAGKFDKHMLLDPLIRNRDKLAGLHANQHIPQVTGYLRIYDLTGREGYLKAAVNFWQMVAGHRLYAIGGVSEAEMFREPDRFASYLTDKTCETCCAHNLLKLTRQLFCHDPRPAYADTMERTLFNQILASQDPQAPHTAVTYFMPLNPGALKTYSDDYSHFTCCHGTGMENHTKYQAFIYFRSRDGGALYVNLYLPSVLNWREKGLRITQQPLPSTGDIRFTINGSGRMAVKLRIPSWASRGVFLAINQKQQKIEARPGTYLSLDRHWNNNDQITLHLTIEPRLERLPDIPDIAGIMAGPYVLVGLSDRTDWIHLDLDPEHPVRSIKKTDDPLEYMIGPMKLVPLFRAHHRHYHPYFILVDSDRIRTDDMP